MRMRSWKVQRVEGSVVNVESFQPSRNDVSVESFQPSPSSNLSPDFVSVESFQPSPSSNLSPDFKAERTTHGILPHQLPPFVVHSAAKIETYSNQFMAESTPNLTRGQFEPRYGGIDSKLNECQLSKPINLSTFQPSNLPTFKTYQPSNLPTFQPSNPKNFTQ